VLYRLLQAVRYSEFTGVIMMHPLTWLLPALVCCRSAYPVPPLRSVISADRLPLSYHHHSWRNRDGGPLSSGDYAAQVRRDVYTQRMWYPCALVFQRGATWVIVFRADNDNWRHISWLCCSSARQYTSMCIWPHASQNSDKSTRLTGLGSEGNTRSDMVPAM
jgi:hypothetical protein